jgi:hypothetical protein
MRPAGTYVAVGYGFNVRYGTVACVVWRRWIHSIHPGRTCTSAICIMCMWARENLARTSMEYGEWHRARVLFTHIFVRCDLVMAGGKYVRTCMPAGLATSSSSVCLHRSPPRLVSTAGYRTYVLVPIHAWVTCACSCVMRWILYVRTCIGTDGDRSYYTYLRLRMRNAIYTGCESTSIQV